MVHMENQKGRYDAIVIGAGPGGSTIAALLAKKGKKVLLIDKNPRAGGRMMTIVRDGFHYELFPINCVPQKGSHYEEVLRMLGKESLIEGFYPKHPGVIMYETEEGKINTWLMGASPIGMMKCLGIKLYKLKEIVAVFKALKELATMKKAEIDKLYDISAMEYFKKYNVPNGLRTYFLSTFGEGAFEMPSDKTSAAEMIKLFQVTARGGGGRYYKKGIGHVFETIASIVPESGGTALYSTRVKQINVEAEKVQGVTLDNGDTYDAPLVISNAGLRQTVLKLVGEQHFTKDYVDWAKQLESNLACAGFRWFLNAPVLKHSTYIYYPEGCALPWEHFERMARGEAKPEKSYIYLGTTSVFPGVSPEGKQMVYACMSCLPDPKLDIQPYLEYVESRVRKIMPDLFNHIEKTETFGPAQVPGLGNDIVMPGQGGEAYGLALSVGQTGSKQPDMKSPIEGLYYVGCDAGGSGLGTHQAMDSALNLFKLLST
jgi:phytoene dehydrogenase-like protein